MELAFLRHPTSFPVPILLVMSPPRTTVLVLPLSCTAIPWSSISLFLSHNTPDTLFQLFPSNVVRNFWKVFPTFQQPCTFGWTRDGGQFQWSSWTINAAKEKQIYIEAFQTWKRHRWIHRQVIIIILAVMGSMLPPRHVSLVEHWSHVNGDGLPESYLMTRFGALSKSLFYS